MFILLRLSAAYFFSDSNACAIAKVHRISERFSALQYVGASLVPLDAPRSSHEVNF